MEKITKTAADLRNDLMHSVTALTDLRSMTAEGTTAEVKHKLDSAYASLTDLLGKVNSVEMAEYISANTLHDIIKAEYVTVTALLTDEETGEVSLSTTDRKVKASDLVEYLPEMALETMEALGRVAAYLGTVGNTIAASNRDSFVMPKKNKKGKVSPHEQKVYNCILTLKNSEGNYTMKALKTAFTNFIDEVSEHTIDIKVTSGMLRDFITFAVKRGKNWGEREVQSASVYHDLFLEYIHAVLMTEEEAE